MPLSDFVSTLIIENVERSHSGNYTCTATNIAAVSNYTAPLVVLGEYSVILEIRTRTKFARSTDGQSEPHF